MRCEPVLLGQEVEEGSRVCRVGDAHGAVECAVAFDCGFDGAADESEDFEEPYSSLFWRWVGLLVVERFCRVAAFLSSGGCTGGDDIACFAGDEP